jgi:hypothetical protein
MRSFFIIIFLIALFKNNFLSNKIDIKRDGTLQDLVKLLSQSDNQHLFHDWKVDNDNEMQYFKFTSSLTPWIIAEPRMPLLITDRPSTLNSETINCKDKRYSQIFNGKKLSTSRFIVDLVPFGYDIDTLEIRLFETYDIVDIFIIYEAPRTQSAHLKPLYYSLIQNTTRFKKWNDKILYFAADDKNLQTFATRTRNGPRSGPLYLKERFALEKSMRSEPIRLLKQLSIYHPLKSKIISNIDNAWMLQNDGDELPGADALAHFKYCELLNNSTNEIYFPSFPFKKNYNWIQMTKDLGCMKGGNINPSNEYLKFHTWRPGPYIQQLADVLKDGETKRHRKSDSITPCAHHLGLGAATHLSSVAEPVSYILKRYSVIEQNHRGSLTKEFVNAGRSGHITDNILFKETLFSWCDAIHVSELKTEEGKSLVWTSLPWIVRYNPWRYPFMLPTVQYDNMMGDLDIMMKGKVISDDVILLWNQTVHSAKSYPSTYGRVIVFNSTGIIEKCGLPEWKNKERCTNNW